MGAPVAATAERAPPPRAVPSSFGDHDAGHARKGVEGGGHGAGGLSDLCVDDEPAIGGSRQSGDAFKFLDEFFIQLVASSGVNDDQVGGRTGLQPVPYDGDSVLVVRFAVHLDGGVLQELRKLGVGTGSVNVGFDDCDAQTVLFAVPLGEFCGGGGFPLTVQANQQQRGAPRGWKVVAGPRMRTSSV